jgi:cation diffusion facilitator CzcD-associated flavoprotein CzcO
VYVSSEELYQYFKRFAQKHDLEKFIRLEQQVVGAKWNGDSWDVEIKDCKSDSSGNSNGNGNGRIYRDQCDILINATGVLNNWKFPAIPGLHDFKGQLLHSANWDPSVSLDGKTVGLIGNG